MGHIVTFQEKKKSYWKTSQSLDKKQMVTVLNQKYHMSKGLIFHACLEKEKYIKCVKATKLCQRVIPLILPHPLF